MNYHYTTYLLRDTGTTIEDVLVNRLLKPEMVSWCESVLKSFDFVKWDRFTRTATNSGLHLLTFYGWIDRAKDSYKDFAVISISLDRKSVTLVTTSSSEYSKKMSDMCCELSGFRPVQHKNCARVEDLFKVQNSIKLGQNGNAQEVAMEK